MPFLSLWIPVLASAVAVFVVSSIMHMVLKYHSADYKAIPNEDGVRESLGKANLAPGLYHVPHCTDMKQMGEPAMKVKFEKGPVAVITVIPNGLPPMPKFLAQWFLFSMFVSFTAAYVARHTLHPGTDGMLVMRITGTVAFAAYGFTNVLDSIWKGQPWGNTGRALIDGAVYAVTTGLVFRLLWPAV
jgi:hypothetical protein